MASDDYTQKHLRLGNAMDTMLWWLTGIKHPSYYADSPRFHEYTEGITSGFVWKIHIKHYEENKDAWSTLCERSTGSESNESDTQGPA